MNTGGLRSLIQNANVSSLPFLEKVFKLVPAMIAIYNIKTGQYIYLNDGIYSILGYKKETILKKGVTFVSSLIHPDDLPKIIAQNKTALQKANYPKGQRQNDNHPVTFEYRIKHHDNSWRWLHSDGLVFDRNTNDQVEYVMNISIDITEHKNTEETEKRKRDQAEEEKNIYHHNQMRLIKLRAEVADVLRKGGYLNKIIEDCLTVVVKNLPSTFARLWLINDTDHTLELIASSGDYPPLNTIKQKLKMGEFAVGMVAQNNKAFITNNLHGEKKLFIQNNTWSKQKKIKSFAGYPLYFQNKTVGVISVFADHDFSENTLISLANVADILAQEIARKKIETQLSQSQQRYLAFLKQSSEGIWRFELEVPIATSASIAKQIDHFYQYAYLAECNDAAAKMYGFNKAEDILGARLGDMLVREDQKNIDYLKNFISSSYHLSNAESVEIDRKNKVKFFQNSLVGTIEQGYLVRAWGIQRDITPQKKAEEEMKKMARQKDEFIAIASHELKTPITSLKAYTQVLEKRFLDKNDHQNAQLLHKMDKQFNRLITLITDLLDISKIEAGKLQFEYKSFKINNLITEIVEEMQRTTSFHTIKTEVEENSALTGDRNRIGQVLINFISNAIKYSPEGKKIIVKTHIKNNQLTVAVRDFGIGIAKQDQAHVFKRFYRSKTTSKESFPGLGLGLYICKEIIERHHGKVGVKSKVGEGTTFFFTLPITH